MAANVTMDPDLIKNAYDYIVESATPMESKEKKDKPETMVYRYVDRSTVPNSVYTKYLKNNGMPPDAVDKMTKLEQGWNAAAAKFAAERVKKLIPTALADKEFMKVVGPKGIKASLNTMTKDGKRNVTVIAYSENRNPSAAPGDENQITKSYARVDTRHTITKDMPVEIVQEFSDEIEKMLKGKF